MRKRQFDEVLEIAGIMKDLSFAREEFMIGVYDPLHTALVALWGGSDTFLGDLNTVYKEAQKILAPANREEAHGSENKDWMFRLCEALVKKYDSLQNCFQMGYNWIGTSK